MPVKKIDFKKEFGRLYFPSAKEVVAIDLPDMNFAMVHGKGDPNTSREYRDAREALFGASYAVKFALKLGGVADFKVAPLEGLWWSAKGAEAFAAGGRKDDWEWISMIMQPDVVSQDRFQTVVSQLREKKDWPALSRIQLERFHEGSSAQVLYVGPYAAEGPTIERIHAFIRDRGWRLTGRHHEIYLSDPRKTPQERLRTVIRQPFSK